MKNDTQNDTQKTWFYNLTKSNYQDYREKNPLTQLTVFANISKKPSFLDKIVAVYLCVTGLNSYDDPVPNGLIIDGVYDLITCGVSRNLARVFLNVQGDICSNMRDTDEDNSSPLEHCSVDRCLAESLAVMLFAATSAIALSVDIIPRHAFALAFAIIMTMPVGMQHLYSKMLTDPSETENMLTENTLVARV